MQLQQQTTMATMLLLVNRPGGPPDALSFLGGLPSHSIGMTSFIALQQASIEQAEARQGKSSSGRPTRDTAVSGSTQHGDNMQLAMHTAIHSSTQQPSDDIGGSQDLVSRTRSSQQEDKIDCIRIST